MDEIPTPPDGGGIFTGDRCGVYPKDKVRRSSRVAELGLPKAAARRVAAAAETSRQVPFDASEGRGDGAAHGDSAADLARQSPEDPRGIPGPFRDQPSAQEWEMILRMRAPLTAREWGKILRARARVIAQVGKSGREKSQERGVKAAEGRETLSTERSRQPVQVDDDVAIHELGSKPVGTAGVPPQQAPMSAPENSGVGGAAAAATAGAAATDSAVLLSAGLRVLPAAAATAATEGVVFLPASALALLPASGLLPALSATAAATTAGAAATDVAVLLPATAAGKPGLPLPLSATAVAAGSGGPRGRPTVLGAGETGPATAAQRPPGRPLRQDATRERGLRRVRPLRVGVRRVP
jgi:hypothetical protein